VIQLARLTWLWSPSCESGGESIVVRGHVVCSARSVRVHQPVKPIVCTIAADAHHHHEEKNNDSPNNSTHSDITVDESLPSRFDHPQSKIASWTRLRKKLENPETYKPSGVAEVLMVRSTESGALELLEGLSSNLFVLYKDGTLRTPTEGVLHGYVRHLVLECAPAIGLTVHDSKPILLHDVHEWREAFITSSSRLIFPISKMLLHHGQDEQGTAVFRDFWQDSELVMNTDTDEENATERDTEKPAKWQELLDEILRRGGYPTNEP